MDVPFTRYAAPFTRYALIRSGALAIADYLPSNYEVIHRDGVETVIAGRDRAGWSLDAYVLPRLASGLYFGQEIDLSHPIMKLIPEDGAQEARAERLRTPEGRAAVKALLEGMEEPS